MIGNTLKDEKGNVLTAPAAYQPSAEVKKLIHEIKQDYTTGDQIQTTPYAEFNDKTLVSRLNLDAQLFAGYVDPASNDPDEAWKANVVRPLTRNKIISIAAHVTARLLYPKVFAQNQQDEEDRNMAQVMRDLIEWNIKNSRYDMAFLQGIIQALASPAVIMKIEFVEAVQKVKVKLEDGTMGLKEAVDEIYSGFNASIVPVDELLIANVYQPELQKQRFLIRRRYIDHGEAKSLYKDHLDFTYVRPGYRVFYDGQSDLFYERLDEINPSLIEECVYYNREEDLQLTFVNGILVSKSDQPMKHRRVAIAKDGTYISVPVYPFAKSGFELTDPSARFFYYKSAAFKLAPEQAVIDQMYKMVLDGTYLSIIPPVGIFGMSEGFNTSVMIPGGVTAFGNKDVKMESLSSNFNLASGWNAINALEKSMAESTQDTGQQGIPAQGDRTAFEVQKLEQNARVLLGLFGKMIGRLVVDVGMLMVDVIVNHQTIGEVAEITAGIPRMKFRTFLLQDAQDSETKGKKVSKKIILTDEDLSKNRKDKSFDLMKKEEDAGDKRIVLVNPEAVRKMKYFITYEADELGPRNENFERALSLDAYDRMILNPFANKEAVSRDFLFSPLAKGDADKYMKSAQEMQSAAMMMPPQEGQPQQPQPMGVANRAVQKGAFEQFLQSR